MTVSSKSRAADDSVSPALGAISQRLVAARRKVQALPEFPGELPKTLDPAYAIQTASIARWPDAIGGWKVGMVPDDFRTALAAERLAGPIFVSSIVDIDPGNTQTMPIFSDGFAAVEAEFMLKIGSTIEPEFREYSDDELADLIAAVHIGAEIASSPMAMVNKLGPCCVVSDFGNNAGLIVGPCVPDWRSLSPDAMKATVSVDGAEVGTATARAIEGGLLQVLRYLLALFAIRRITLAKGTYISSGALTGIHEVAVDSKALVDFGEFGAFNVLFESMQPSE